MKKLLIIGLAATPMLAFGATTVTGGFAGLLLDAQRIINRLIGIVFSLALAAFFWGLAKYILSLSGDKKNYEEGINIMKWGILTLVIMTSIWGIVEFLKQGFGL